MLTKPSRAADSVVSGDKRRSPVCSVCVCVCVCVCVTTICAVTYSSLAREDELHALIDTAKEDLFTASSILRAMIRAFKHSQVNLTPTKGPNDSGK